MRQQNCVLPYLTLAPASSSGRWSPNLFADLRQGDVVYLRSGEKDHLAVITSIAKDRKTLSCYGSDMFRHVQYHSDHSNTVLRGKYAKH